MTAAPMLAEPKADDHYLGIVDTRYVTSPYGYHQIVGCSLVGEARDGRTEFTDWLRPECSYLLHFSDHAWVVSGGGLPDLRFTLHREGLALSSLPVHGSQTLLHTYLDHRLSPLPTAVGWRLWVRTR
ncbi:hypothetical protein AB0M43_36435 [Longispora sp. NPDC051575]|uniref:hypothetical protein n=1 Tax=Longispora sp. NPDC051575 TaxID=3154943 RepID=UPI00341728F7